MGTWRTLYASLRSLDKSQSSSCVLTTPMFRFMSPVLVPAPVLDLLGN